MRRALRDHVAVTILVAAMWGATAPGVTLAQTTEGPGQPAPQSQTTQSQTTEPAPSPAPTPETQSRSEEIVVTGTRIRSPNANATSPIQAIGQEEFKLQGTYEASNILNTIPQNYQNAAIDFSNTPNPLSGPGGVTTADLRGLGPQRTLVLVDGVRLGLGDANAGNPNPAPDLDQIPGQLVERVDVVTGGASAVYGSDAVAGVVNFILRKNFQGLQVDGRYGFAQHANEQNDVKEILRAGGALTPPHHVIDGENGDISVMLGMDSPDHNGNITGYFSYHRQNPVSQSQRDFSGCLLTPTEGSFACANSSNSNIFVNADTGDAFAVFGNTFVVHPLAGGDDPGISPPARFNSSPFQYLSRDDTRYLGGYVAHYDINPQVNLYSTFNFMDDRTRTVVAPSGLFQSNGLFAVNCDNPLLSEQQAGAIGCGARDPATSASLVIGRRNVEGQPRISFYEHLAYRFVAGVRGDITDNWHYDVYGQYYYSTLEYQLQNDVSKTRIRNALQVVRDPATGAPICRAKLSGADPLCVPYNIFSDGAVTPAALGYIQATGQASGTTQQQIVNGTITGDLGYMGAKSPWANDGIGVAIGAEYRREEASYSPDALFQSGELAGNGGSVPATSGHFDVSEIFGEVRAPIVQDRPYMYEIALEGGFRHSDYSSAGTTDTYKAGAQYAPIDGMRFRTSYQRAVRAPNVTELYVPQYVTNSAILGVDPCSGPTPDASFAQCANTGVTAAQYGRILACPAGQCSVQQGGNIALKPETSDTVSVGFILTPALVHGLTASVDYYRIKQKDVIGSIPITTTLQNCLDTGDPLYCSRIRRTAQGFLFGDTVTEGGFVAGPLENLASTENTGIDIQVSYTLPTPAAWGQISAQLAGTYVISAKVRNSASSPEYDCAGLFGPTCGTVTPTWRHTARINWQSPWDVLLSAQWRYIGISELDNNSGDPTLRFGSVGDYDFPDRKLKPVHYLDLSAEWNLSQTMTVRGSVNNVFDQDPQVISANPISGIGGPNAYPTYDLLGRVFSVGFTASF